jgi:hypothetical protein
MVIMTTIQNAHGTLWRYGLSAALAFSTLLVYCDNVVVIQWLIVLSSGGGIMTILLVTKY